VLCCAVVVPSGWCASGVRVAEAANLRLQFPPRQLGTGGDPIIDDPLSMNETIAGHIIHNIPIIPIIHIIPIIPIIMFVFLFKLNV